MWEAGPEPGGCQGVGVYDDLKIGTPVEVSAGGEKLASATVTRTKNLIAGCVLVATIDAVPAAKAYTFKFDGFPGQEVAYASVAAELERRVDALADGHPGLV